MKRYDEYFFRRLDGYIFEILMRGYDDWVDACEIVDVIFNLDSFWFPDVDQKHIDLAVEMKIKDSEGVIFARDMSLAIIHRLLDENYMLIGDISDHGFKPWKINTYGALSVVQRLWDEEMEGKLPGLGWYWLCNTDKGNELGAKVLDDWQRFYKWGKYEEKPDQGSDA